MSVRKRAVLLHNHGTPLTAVEQRTAMNIKHVDADFFSGQEPDREQTSGWGEEDLRCRLQAKAILLVEPGRGKTRRPVHNEALWFQATRRSQNKK